MKRLIKYLLHVESSAACSVAFGFRSVIGCRNGSRARTQKVPDVDWPRAGGRARAILRPMLQLHHKLKTREVSKQ